MGNLNAYSPASNLHAAVKAVLGMFILEEPQPDNDTYTAGLRTDHTMELLYHEDMLRGPTTVFRILREHFVLKRISYVDHSNSNSITYGHINMFLTSDEDCDVATPR